MPFEPLRFVHAANLLLDCPPSIPLNVESLDSSLQREIEQATLRAFESLIDICIDRDVDFLLLGGNTFVEIDYSLPARIALRNGWNRMREAGIRIYVLPGECDPPDAWTRIPEVPDCVTVLNLADTEPLAVLRNGTLIAAFAAASTKAGGSHPTGPHKADGLHPGGSHPTGPFRIGLCPINADGRPVDPRAMFPSAANTACTQLQSVLRPNTSGLSGVLESNGFDYLAVAGRANRLLLRSDAGLIHHPGPTQSLHGHADDPGGCTLVEVNARDDIRCTNLPTAAVRFQTIKLTADRDQPTDELLIAMQSRIDQIEPASNERVHVIEWRLGASVPEDDAMLLLNDLPVSIGDDSPVALVHHLPQALSNQATPTDEEADDSLTEEYRRELQEFVAAGGFDPHEAISGVDGLSNAAADELHAFASEFETESLTTAAERQGTRRLQAAAD